MNQHNPRTSNLEKLKQITHKLSSQIDSSFSQPHAFKLNSASGVGTILGFNILDNETDVFVTDFYLSEGAVKDWHKHDEKQIIIVYKGEIEIETAGDECNLLETAGVEVIPKGMLHKIKAVTNASYISVIVPYDNSFSV